MSNEERESKGRAREKTRGEENSRGEIATRKMCKRKVTENFITDRSYISLSFSFTEEFKSTKFARLERQVLNAKGKEKEREREIDYSPVARNYDVNLKSRRLVKLQMTRFKRTFSTFPAERKIPRVCRRPSEKKTRVCVNSREKRRKTVLESLRKTFPYSSLRMKRCKRRPRRRRRLANFPACGRI